MKPFGRCALVVLAFGAWACDAGSPDLPPTPDEPVYLPLDSPENLLANLQVACRARNTERYGELLAPEFVFRLQPDDALAVGRDSLSRADDLAGMGRAFTQDYVHEFRILLHPDPATADGREGSPPGAVAIRVGASSVQVDQVENDVTTTWTVGDDIESFYFRPGNAEAGEDTTRWFLFEWRDIEAPHSLLEGTAEEPAPVRRFTWGQLKTMF